MTENVPPHRHPQFMLDFYRREEREIVPLRDESMRAFLLRLLRSLQAMQAKG